MNINEYIDFEAIWNEEIDLTGDFEEKYSELLNNFLFEINNYDGLELLVTECDLRDNGNLLFFWSESGGQNESDNQGWSRDYSLLFNSEFELIDIEYSHG